MTGTTPVVSQRAPGTAAPVRALSRGERVSFGVGGLATGLFTTVPGLVLLYYLTDTLGVAAGLAGAVVTIPRLLDLVFNPLSGRLSDRTAGRWGPRRPWMAAGALLLPVTFVSIFWSPFTGDVAALWVGLAFALSGAAFSMFIVPWSSLPAEIGPDAATRTSMMSWRIVFLALAILLAGGLAPALVEMFGDGPSGYRSMALTFAPVMLVAMGIATFVGARRSTRASVATAAETGTLREALRAVRASRPLRSMFVVIILCEVAASVALTGGPYIADHVIGSEDALVPIFICLVAPLMLTMPLWSRAATRWGKRPALQAAAAVFALGAGLLIALLFVPDAAKLPVALFSISVMGTGFAGTSMLPPAMFADAVAYEARTVGKRRVGLLTGASNAAETIAGSIGAGVYAAVLSLTGFISSEGVQVTQSTTARLGIVLGVAAVSVLVVSGVILVLRRYEMVEADIDQLGSPSRTDTATT
ncbi:MFS transporter [Umezawaea endophytica]|uniref:MFS transporter n=1 Tax=Umezawaea endophytica TaxID=1654476 RepID=A0A9X2VPH2_9PSEU|nr:MFS transporter [Umezawaea endophytica]MCS7480393.1 MFS transporter [Umezawaea endophytica]